MSGGKSEAEWHALAYDAMIGVPEPLSFMDDVWALIDGFSRPVKDIMPVMARLHAVRQSMLAAERGAQGGVVKSKAKSRAARENGKKGGRPLKSQKL